MAWRWRKGRLIIFACGMLVSLATALSYVWPPPFLSFLNQKTYDTLLIQAPRQDISPLPLIVELDDQSLAAHGQWPWPRYRLAQLLDQLRQLGAAVIALDIVLPEADRSSLKVLRQDLERDLGHKLEVQGLDPAREDNDEILAQTLAQGPFVLGYKFTYAAPPAGQAGPCRLHPVNAVFANLPPGRRGTDLFFQAQGAVCSLERLSAAVKRSGFFDVGLDRDGILRRAPLIIARQGKLHPSLALAAYLQLKGLNQVMVLASPAGPERLRLRDLEIPLDRQGNLLINYRDPARRFPSFSAAQVLAGQVEAAQVKGRAVFVGVTATGLKDVRATPLEGTFPGVAVHATILDNLLRADFLEEPAWAQGLELALTLGLGLAAAAVLAWLNAAWGAALLLGGAASLWGAANFLMQTQGLFISPLWPVIALTANFSLLTLARFWGEEVRARRRSAELVRTQHAAIISLAALAETRHNETGAHIRRTQRYVQALAQKLSSHPKYRRILDDSYIDLLAQSAPLHDVGKVGVPDAILLKPGRLTPEEFEEIKKHTIYGMEAIRMAERELGESSFLSLAREIAYCHHEKWDGSGYPRGLKREDIPLPGRLMALADVYDALISRRVYKPAMSHAQAMGIILEGRGTFFDPELTDAFLGIQAEIAAIAQALADSEPPPEPQPEPVRSS